MLESVKSADDLTEYLTLLFGGEEGYVYVPTKQGDVWTPTFFQWPAQQVIVEQHIRLNSPTADVYICPSLFGAPDAKKEFVKGSNVFWVDFDGKLPSDLGSVPAPSMIVESSDPANKKQHWYWRLENFETDVKIIEKVNRALAYQLDADYSGWDCNQVLRPPTSKNHKYGSPQNVTLLSVSPWQINPSSFGGVPEPPVVSTEFNVGNLQDPNVIISKYPWPLQAFNLYRTRVENITHAEGRSGALMQLAYFGAEMGMEDVEIFTLLYYADERWGKFKDRPDKVRRLNDIIVKARIKHPKITLQVTELPVMGFKNLLEADTKVEWVIPNLLEQSGQFIVSAKPGVGKSRISLQAFIHMALGKPFLKYEASEPQKLIYFSLEMGVAQLGLFAEKMATSLTDKEISLLQTNLLVVPLGEALYLDKSAGQKLVEDVLNEASTQQNPYTGYAFDSLSRTTAESVNDEPALKAIMDWDARIRNHYGVFSWFVHHNRKASVGNRKPKDMDDLLGATVIQANATAIYTLWRNNNTDSDIEFINVKQRLAEVEHAYILSSRPDLTFVPRANIGDDFINSLPGAGLGLPSNLPDSPPNGGEVVRRLDF